MSQSSLTSYFSSRKRPHADELSSIKSKQIYLDEIEGSPDVQNDKKISLDEAGVIETKANSQNNVSESTRATKRRLPCIKQSDQANTAAKKQKVVHFTKAERLSPKKKIVSNGESKLAKMFETMEKVKENAMRTPTKEEQIAKIKAHREAQKAKKAMQNMPIDQVREKIIRGSRLADLKESLAKLHALEESRQKLMKLNGKLSGNFELDKVLPNVDQMNNSGNTYEGKNLKPFQTIELEILSSPQRGLRTPTKSAPASLLPDVDSNELMSPKKTPTPRRLFSPTKESPSKSLPAYQRFQSLIEAGRPTLQLPYKYRCLAETFKAVDTVCSMYFNRQEQITMKKLKPAVQRMMRKNFSETYLAQINYLYPDAYKFYQKKMLNPGSHTKYDYYQLVITPNVVESCENLTKETNTDDIIKSGQQKAMNPQVMIERQQQFHKLLLNLVKDEHDKFLQNLNPPMNIHRDKVTRWHPEFDLQSCPDIFKSELPQPPNVEKFSSAKAILSTARNLFDCVTPSERIMQRYEARQKLEKNNDIVEPIPYDPVATVLKGVPKSLLERIRARQAAKALDSMTRRPSQDKECNNYARLPELARHIRNIFITESKSVLDLESVLNKLENSYRERVARDEMKMLLKLLAKETPYNWFTFHHIRKTDFVKINKNLDLLEIIKKLEVKAEEKR